MGQPANSRGESPAADDWITAMAARLAHLHDADEATIWAAIPAQWLIVTGEPCDTKNAYHIALAAAVVRSVRGG